jgi:hypothetical protein
MTSTTLCVAWSIARLWTRGRSAKWPWCRWASKVVNWISRGSSSRILSARHSPQQNSVFCPVPPNSADVFLPSGRNGSCSCKQELHAARVRESLLAARIESIASAQKKDSRLAPLGLASRSSERGASLRHANCKHSFRPESGAVFQAHEVPKEISFVIWPYQERRAWMPMLFAFC